jgi:hypothetical protein
MIILFSRATYATTFTPVVSVYYNDGEYTGSVGLVTTDDNVFTMVGLFVCGSEFSDAISGYPPTGHYTNLGNYDTGTIGFDLYRGFRIVKIGQNYLRGYRAR